MYTEDEILDRIDEWHNGHSSEELYEYLGWTWDEYRDWVATGKQPKSNNRTFNPS